MHLRRTSRTGEQSRPEVRREYPPLSTSSSRSLSSLSSSSHSLSSLSSPSPTIPSPSLSASEQLHGLRLKSKRLKRKCANQRIPTDFSSAKTNWRSRWRFRLPLTLCLLFFTILIRCSSGADDAGNTAPTASSGADDDATASGNEVQLVESLAGARLQLPCTFVNKVYSPEYDATWIVEWKKTHQDAEAGMETGSDCA